LNYFIWQKFRIFNLLILLFNNWQFILFRKIISSISGFLGLRHKNEIEQSVKDVEIILDTKPTEKKEIGKRKERINKKNKDERKKRREKIILAKTLIKQEEKVIVEDNWDPAVFAVPEAEGKTRFTDLNLPNPILHAIYDLGFKYCTDIQAQCLPKSLEGQDITAQAQTGTGKTAAFLITVFTHLIKKPLQEKRKHGTPRALILAPTRELAMQIEKDARLLGKYINFNLISIVGGIDYKKQQNILHSGFVDIVIATPGRLIDFIEKKLISLESVEILVIDEADRMLDMGFLPSVRKIVLSTPPKVKRQTMFFTATMTFDVKNLAESWTRNAFDIAIKPEEKTIDTVEQITYITTVEEKRTLLYNLVVKKNFDRVLVFANRRDEARLLKDTFTAYGISCALLSGEVDQAQRIKRLEAFRSGKIRILVATDVAARGIHVDAITHVINYNIPQDIEEYIHRIGRTGRAGASGIAISFADEDSSYELMKLEEFLGKKFDCIYPDDDLLTPIPEQFAKIKPPKSITSIKRSFKGTDGHHKGKKRPVKKGKVEKKQEKLEENI
jgi:ATP-dependent RNA helicase RhlB